MATLHARAALALDLLRAAALGLTLCAVGTAVALTNRADAVRQIDTALFDRVVGSQQRRLLGAVQEQQADPVRAAARFEALRRESEAFELGDHQEKVWAVATFFLAQNCIARNQLDTAVALAREVAERRPRNLTMQFLYADALQAKGNLVGRDECLAALFEQLPEQEEVARRTLEAALSQQQWQRAGKVLGRHLAKPQPFRFEGSYTVAPQLPAALPMQRAIASPTLSADGRLSLWLRLPAGADAVEIRLPPAGHYDLDELELQVDGTTIPPERGLGNPATGAVRVRGEEAPAVGYRFAQPLAHAADIEWRARFASRVPAWQSAVLSEPIVTAVLGALAGDDDALARIDQRRRWALLQTPEQAHSTGPAGAGDHAVVSSDGWCTPRGANCALTTRIDRTVQTVRFPVPAARRTVDPHPVELQLDPPTSPQPEVQVGTDHVELRWPTPRMVGKVTLVVRL